MSGGVKVNSSGPLVIKLGGLAVEEPSRAGALMQALVSLHEREAGGLVVVHGGGKAVDQRLERLGMTTARAAGLRVTPPEQMVEVSAVLSGVVRARLVGALGALGAKAVGISLADGGLTEARKLEIPGADLGRVGEVVGGDGRVVHALLNGGFLPVISSIAADEDGELLNVNADDAAAAVAGIVAARLLVLLTDVPGVRLEDGTVAESLDGAAIERLVAAGVIHGGMIPKARAALAAAGRAGAPVLISSWSEPERLRLIGSEAIPGTMILPAPSSAANQQGVLR